MAGIRVVRVSDGTNALTEAEIEANKYKLTILRVSKEAIDPKRAYNGTAVGLDLFTPYELAIRPRTRVFVDTGIKVIFPSLPVATYGEIGEQLLIL